MTMDYDLQEEMKKMFGNNSSNSDFNTHAKDQDIIPDPIKKGSYEKAEQSVKNDDDDSDQFLDALNVTFQNDNDSDQTIYTGEIVHEPIYDEDFIPEGKSYRTKQVAEMLGMPEQSVRNIASAFEEYLPKIERTESGQRLFKKADIERLETIVRLKNEKNLTYPQIKELIDKDTGKFILAKTEEEKTEALVTAITHRMSDEIKMMLSEQLKEIGLSQQKLLEASSHEKEQYLQHIELLENKLNERDKEIELMRNEISKLRDENSENNKQIMEKLEKRRFGLFRR